MVGHETVGNKVDSGFFFEVTNLEFINEFLVREIFCSRVEEVVRKNF